MDSDRTTQSDRSFVPISDDDLRRLGNLAGIDRRGLFERKPNLGRYFRNRLFAVALCQGAALHRIDGVNGIKDFDVWSFYYQDNKCSYPYRRRGVIDFGDPKFGKTPGCEHLIGRKVDLLGRSLSVRRGINPIEAIRDYLDAGNSLSARCLAAKAVILIEPKHLLGYIVWPPADEPLRKNGASQDCAISNFFSPPS